MHSPIWDHAGAGVRAARSVCARLQRKLRGSGKLETGRFFAHVVQCTLSVGLICCCSSWRKASFYFPPPRVHSRNFLSRALPPTSMPPPSPPPPVLPPPLSPEMPQPVPSSMLPPSPQLQLTLGGTVWVEGQGETAFERGTLISKPSADIISVEPSLHVESTVGAATSPPAPLAA